MESLLGSVLLSMITKEALMNYTLNKLSFLFLGVTMSMLAGCQKNDSQVIVLYRDSVAPGNSVVEFVSHNDETGQYATVHCEQLRQLYKEKEKIEYFCSTIVFDEFRPTIR